MSINQGSSNSQQQNSEDLIDEENDIQMQLLPLDHKEEVEIFHDLQSSSLNVFRRSQEMSQLSLPNIQHIAKMLATVYFSYYALFSIPLMTIYTMQLNKADVRSSDLSQVDRDMLKFIKIGLYFVPACVVFYTINAAYLNRQQQQRSKFFFIFFFMTVMAIKILYYSWAVDGILLYLNEIRENTDEIQLEIFRYGITFISIVNMMDLIRIVACIVFAIIFHITCKVKARKYRTNVILNPNNLEASQFSEGILRDAENLYRYLAVKDLPNITKIKKSFKIINLNHRNVPQKTIVKTKEEKDDRMCPICCDEMDLAIQMPCDARHLFHEKCIQQWLDKHRECPLCKVKVI
eukprot:403364406